MGTRKTGSFYYFFDLSALLTNFNIFNGSIVKSNSRKHVVPGLRVVEFYPFTENLVVDIASI